MEEVEWDDWMEGAGKLELSSMDAVKIRFLLYKCSFSLEEDASFVVSFILVSSLHS